MLLAIDNTLADLPSPVPTISLMGDLNFPRTVVTWEEPEEGLLVPLVAGHREGEIVGGKQERLQAQKVMDLALKYGMIQQVDQPTNSINILDLIFCSNTDVISSVVVDNFPLISDHKLITANLAYQTEVQEENLEEMHLTDSGSRLKKLNINMADWPAIQTELELVDWGEMESLVKESPTAAYNWFMKQLIMVMEHHCPARKKRRFCNFNAT